MANQGGEDVAGGGQGWTRGGFLPPTGTGANPKHGHQEAKGLCAPLPQHAQEPELGGGFRSSPTAGAAQNLMLDSEAAVRSQLQRQTDTLLLGESR